MINIGFRRRLYSEGMAKVRLNRHQGKRSSTVVLVLSMLLMLTVVLLMLLALGIFNLPVGSDDEPSSSTYDHIKLKRLNLNVCVFCFWIIEEFINFTDFIGIELCFNFCCCSNEILFDFHLQRGRWRIGEKRWTVDGDLILGASCICLP